MLASREHVFSLIEKATMGTKELTDFPKDPVMDAQKRLENMKEEVGAAAEQDPKEDPEVGDGAKRMMSTVSVSGMTRSRPPTRSSVPSSACAYATPVKVGCPSCSSFCTATGTQ